MNAEFEKAMGDVRVAYENLERGAQNLVFARETAVKFQYELRAFIEGEQKRKVDEATILAAVLTKLKAVTPHGPNNQVDA